MRQRLATYAPLMVVALMVFFPQRTLADAWSSATQQPEILDIEVGEPFNDAMARSTRKHDFSVPLDMQGLELWSGGEDHLPLQIVLRNGAGQSVALPYQPDSGMLWMYVGVTDELDLNFHTYTPLDREGDFGGQDADQQAAGDIEAIVRIYTGIMQMTLRAREQSSCSHDSQDTSKMHCDRVTVLMEKLGPSALREELRAFLTLVSEETYDGRLPARVLSLGQWWLPNGSLVSMTVTASYRRSSNVPLRLAMNVNVSETVNSQFGRQILECYDQQAIFPEKMLYSQAQAAHIFHGLYVDYFPPVVDGERVTDPIRRAELDWGQIFFNYWQDPENLSRFCERLHVLEREAGYSGPFAPPRQRIVP